MALDIAIAAMDIIMALAEKWLFMSIPVRFVS
jgi:hypothetical protein